MAIGLIGLTGQHVRQHVEEELGTGVEFAVIPRLLIKEDMIVLETANNKILIAIVTVVPQDEVCILKEIPRIKIFFKFYTRIVYLSALLGV